MFHFASNYFLIHGREKKVIFLFYFNFILIFFFAEVYGLGVLFYFKLKLVVLPCHFLV